MASVVQLTSRGGVNARTVFPDIAPTISSLLLVPRQAILLSGHVSSYAPRLRHGCRFSTSSPVSSLVTPHRAGSRTIASVRWSSIVQNKALVGRGWHVRSTSTGSDENSRVVKDAGTSTPSNTPSTPSPPKSKISKLIQQRLPQSVPHENIYTIPNFLTLTRLIAAPAVGYFVLHSEPLWAVSLFFYAGITDMVDGYLARKYHQQTVVGTVIDPMADKALMTIAVVTLTMNGTLPVWLAVIILGRDVALAISAIYFRWISLPPPKTMARYWDFSLPSAEVHPTEISKINTFLQLLLVGNAMLLPVLPEAWVSAWNLMGVFEGWSYLVATTTVWSGLSYISNKDAVKILTPQEIDARLDEKEKKDAEAKNGSEAKN